MADLRMPELNKIHISGRLTRDPELRYLPSGMALCKMGIASSRRYKSKDGEQKEDTVFINATAWGKTAEFAGEHIKKGRPVIIEGRLQSNEWEDKESGQRRSTIEINVERIQTLDWEDRGGGSGGGRPAPRVIEEPVPEDDIPF